MCTTPTLRAWLGDDAYCKCISIEKFRYVGFQYVSIDQSTKNLFLASESVKKYGCFFFMFFFNTII